MRLLHRIIVFALHDKESGVFVVNSRLLELSLPFFDFLRVPVATPMPLHPNVLLKVVIIILIAVSTTATTTSVIVVVATALVVITSPMIMIVRPSTLLSSRRRS